MAPRVTVTMTALNGNLDPAIRVLDLDVDRVSIPVGRASKTISKGLQGTQDNAWFDSPVMSRDHAELILDVETDNLAIQDIGSMHGTFLNGTRINTHTLAELNDGDEIVFGAEVRRGAEIFPACAFRISYELAPYKATNSYAFPDTSDNEDADEVDFTDEESENELSSEDDESVIVVGQKFSQSSHAIDLTREESPEHLTQTIDTSDATSAPQMDHGQDLESEDGIVYTPEANVDGQSERYSSEDEYDFEGSVDEDIEEGIAEEPRFETVDDEDAESSVYDDDSDMGASSSQEPPYVRMAEYSSSPTVIKGAERMVIPDDEHNDFGLAKAGEEGMRAMVDAGMVDGVFLQRSKRSFYPYAPCYPSVQSSQLVANSPMIQDTFTSMSQISSSSSTGRPSYANRQPSPSDAAMAKIPDMKDAEIPLSYIRSTANLGQCSGKEEFFKARELNKATIQNQEIWSGRMPESDEAPVEKQVFSTRPIKACATKRMRAMAAANAVEAKADVVAEVKEPTPELPTAEPSSVINELPAVGLIADLQPQPALEPTVQPVRSVLTIDDLIDRTSSDQETVAPKRKAQEISSTEIEDLTIWASALNPTESHSPTPIEVAATISELCGTPEQPPAKKLRRFMEKVTYAALGGVAVGAALFGSLVATAPDFM